jgi:hypothetical protein
MAHSAIVIPVPVLEPVVRPRIQRALPEFVFADPDSVHAHVTLLGPFVSVTLVGAELVNRLQEIFAAVQPFSFSVDGARHTFEDGSVYLKPEPAEPFRTLTDALRQAFPGYPPYGDPSTEPLPHVTLDYGWAPRTGGVQGADLASPVRCTAEMACLNWYEPGKSRTLASFILGPTG